MRLITFHVLSVVQLRKGPSVGSRHKRERYDIFCRLLSSTIKSQSTKPHLHISYLRVFLLQPECCKRYIVRMVLTGMRPSFRVRAVLRKCLYTQFFSRHNNNGLMLNEAGWWCLCRVSVAHPYHFTWGGGEGEDAEAQVGPCRININANIFRATMQSIV